MMLKFETDSIECTIDAENLKTYPKVFSKHDSGYRTKGDDNTFIGAFWSDEGHNTPLIILPKLDRGSENLITDVSGMLSQALYAFDALKEVQEGELYQFYKDQPPIPLENSQSEYLSLLLIVRYLSAMKDLVRKGLKKGYTHVTQNLNAKVKGKVQIAPTIKQNHLKGNILKTVCSYDLFSTDCPENRYLKKALVFAKHMLGRLGKVAPKLSEVIGYVSAPFDLIPDEIDTRSVFTKRNNPFFREYKIALEIANQILNLNDHRLSAAKIPRVYPHWIDMAKLFELYVLGLLKEQYGNNVLYHTVFKGNSQEEVAAETDFILKDQKLVIDAKYKLLGLGTDKVSKDDIRQVAGYARLKKVYQILEFNENEVLSCLIIHPVIENDHKLELDNKKELNNYVKIYKLGISVPKTTFVSA